MRRGRREATGIWLRNLLVEALSVFSASLSLALRSVHLCRIYKGAFTHSLTHKRDGRHLSFGWLHPATLPLHPPTLPCKLAPSRPLYLSLFFPSLSSSPFPARIPTPSPRSHRRPSQRRLRSTSNTHIGVHYPERPPSTLF